MPNSFEQHKQYLDTQIYQEFEEVYAAARSLLASCEAINNNYSSGKEHNIVHYINDMKSDMQQASASLSNLDNLISEETNLLTQI